MAGKQQLKSWSLQSGEAGLATVTLTAPRALKQNDVLFAVAKLAEHCGVDPRGVGKVALCQDPNKAVFDLKVGARRLTGGGGGRLGGGKRCVLVALTAAAYGHTQNTRAVSILRHLPHRFFCVLLVAVGFGVSHSRRTTRWRSSSLRRSKT